MAPSIASADGETSDPFEGRYRRLVEQSSLAWAVLFTLGPLPIHFVVAPEISYWNDAPVLLGIPMAALSWAALFVARRGHPRVASWMLVAGIGLGIWVAAFVATGTQYESLGPFFFVLTPLIAGMLLESRWTLLLGLGHIPFIVAVTFLGVIPLGSAAVSVFLLLCVSITAAVTARLWAQDRLAVSHYQQELERHNHELQAIANAATDAIVQVDAAGRLVVWNQAAAGILGVDEATLQRGERLLDVVTGQVREGVIPVLATAPFRKLQETEKSWHGRSLRLLAHAGDEGLVLVIVDVSKERERARRSAERIGHAMEISKLQEINSFKTRLLNTASHELNTPLTPMRLQLELLKSAARGPLNDKQLRSVEILDRNARRMEMLVRDILDVARMESDRLRIAQAPVALGTLVADEVENIRPAGLRKEIQIMVDVEDLWVHADAQRLAQAIHNLTTNAIKFTPTGGTITVTCQREGSSARVVVRDSGIGIPEDRQLDLFTPFSQFHDESRAHGGTGLGLYICKGIIEAHGGAVGCHSDGEELGSMFWFTIPLGPEGEDELEPLGPQAASALRAKSD